MKKLSVFMKKQKSVATIYLNRPKVKNSLNLQMWQMLIEQLNEVEQDEEIKVLILKGIDEKSFSSGADISEFTRLRSTTEGAKVYNNTVKEAVDNLSNLEIPTVAVVQGYCIGGGFELAISCDIRIADETAIFALTPAKIGLINNVSSIGHLVDLVGPSKAKDLIFSARMIENQEAIRIGLIDRSFHSSEIIENAYNYAENITELAQYTIQGTKKIIKNYKEMDDKKEYIEEIVLHAFESEDYKEGIRAFIEKRRPDFK